MGAQEIYSRACGFSTWRDLFSASVKLRAWRLLVNIDHPCSHGCERDRRVIECCSGVCWFGLQRRTISSLSTPRIKPFTDRGPP